MLRFLIIFLFGCITIPAFNQSSSTTNDLLQVYQKSKIDSNKVRLLLKIDSIYLYKMPDTDAILDSALLMAKQAQAMSASLRFQPGYNDATFLIANSFAEMQQMIAANSVANKIKGAVEIHIFIMIAERYIFRPGELKQNVDSALPYILHAEQASRALQSQSWLFEALCVKAKYYFALGDISNGRSCFKQIIDQCHQKNNVIEEAHWFAELGKYMPHTDSTYDEVISNLNRALEIYKAVNSINDEVIILEDLAFLHKLRQAYLLLAENELKQVIELKRKEGLNNFFNNYAELSEINILRGNNNIGLFYALKAMQNVDSLNQQNFSGGTVYVQVARAYKAVGDKDKSLFYFRLALTHLVSERVEYLFAVAGEIVQSLIEKDSAKEALMFLQSFIKENPPPRYIDKENIAASLGNCYSALHQYDKAEEKYKQMIVLDSIAQQHMSKQSVAEKSSPVTGAEAYYIIGNFYVERSNYALAKQYLEKAISFVHLPPSIARQIDIHSLLFKIDSAQNNYLSAIQHLQIQQRLHDSLFTDRKSKQIAELQIQYETEKKEKDLRVKEQENEKELQRAKQAKNFTYLLIVALIVIIVTGYSRFAQKQNSNKKLEAQREVIDKKNSELQKLVIDKDKLLLDKDNLLEDKQRLVKEIHHRVKNNLQIVISLLNTQSKYLNHKEAIAAITESRHRMQAMSLIHEKLYQSESNRSVNMQPYITELVDHLKASFDGGMQINFIVNVAPVALPLSQSIPLGLILNEVITNSIKYAFLNREAGVIKISMEKLQNEMISLQITDNGAGLPQNVDINKVSSMGMRLVSGLAKQLNATLTVKSDNGVCVELVFPEKNNSSFIADDN